LDLLQRSKPAGQKTQDSDLENAGSYTTYIQAPLTDYKPLDILPVAVLSISTNSRKKRLLLHSEKSATFSFQKKDS